MAKKAKKERGEGITREATPEELERIRNETPRRQDCPRIRIVAADITEYPDGSSSVTLYDDRPWPTPESEAAFRRLMARHIPRAREDGADPPPAVS